MENLELSKELYYNIIDWMKPKYSLTTARARALYLKRMFKEYGILNKETLKKIMPKIKHQHQRACIVMLNKYCYENDIDFHITVPSIRSQASKIPEILSPQEIKVLIEATPKPYDLCIRCIFNMGAGLRISEVIKLSWNHIRWADWIDNKESYGVCAIKGGKGAKDRIVNIPKNLMNDLYEYAKAKRVLNEQSIPVGGMIFPFTWNSNEDFKPELRANNLEKWKAEYVRNKYDWFAYNIIEKYCEKALNKKLHIHQLRHSRATYLYEVEKVPIEQLQVLLGHTNLGTTMVYTRVNPKSVFDKLSNTEEV